MKKKLLTIILSVVMIFGVFGLTGCAGGNGNDDYNYFTSVYDSMADVSASDVRIKQLTYNGIYTMFKTQGNFIVYWGGHYNDATKAGIKRVNDLALQYDITVYNFDPKLDGGLGEDTYGGVYNAASADISNPDIADVSSHLDSLAASLLSVMKTTDMPAQGTLMYVSGAAPTVALSADETRVEVTYNGSISYFSVTPGAADARVQGDFEEVIQRAALRKPSYRKYYDSETGTLSSDAFINSSINEFNLYNDYRLHMAGDYDTATSDYTGEDQSVFVTTTYHALMDLLENSKGMYAVLTGGVWCHNTAAVAQYTNDLAKDYGIDRIYVYDTRLDNGATEDSYTIVDAVKKPGGWHYDSETGDITFVPGDDSTATKEIVVNHNLRPNGVNVNYLQSFLDTRSDEVFNNDSKTYSHLYARLIDTYMPNYVSQWNEDTLTIKGKKESYTKMCVPSLMLFDGDKENAADRLVAFAEAEYEYGYAPWQEAWEEAVKAIFDQNRYATYMPPVETETEGEATDSPSNSSSSSSSGNSTPPSAGSVC